MINNTSFLLSCSQHDPIVAVPGCFFILITQGAKKIILLFYHIFLILAIQLYVSILAIKLLIKYSNYFSCFLCNALSL